MLLHIERQKFLDALTIGSSFCAANKTAPILANVRVTLKGGVFVVSSFNGESAIKYALKLDTAQEDTLDFCLNAKDVISLIQTLKEDIVNFDISENKCSVAHNRGKFEMGIISSDVFVMPTMDENDKVISIDNSILRSMFQDGVNFVSSDELRPVLCGIYLHINNGLIECASSNATILYTNSYNIELDDKDIDLTAIIPKNCVNGIIKTTSKDGQCKVKFGDKNVEFRSSNISVICRKIDARYVNYKSVIPNQCNAKIEVDKDDIINSLKRCNLTCGTTGLVKLKGDNSKLSLKSINVDFSKESEEDLDIVNGDSFECGVNGEKFLTSLSIVEGDMVNISFMAEDKPLKITENNKVVLVMPLKIQ